MQLTTFQKLFQSPPNDCRAIPFWSWNGKLDKAELMRQIDILKEMGFGGFFIHSRVGLETAYLGEEWMSLVKACAAYGKQQKMSVWLYDEDRWPSGTAGGAVTEEPAFRTQYLGMERYDGIAAAHAIYNADTVAAYVCRIEGHTYAAARLLADGEQPGALAAHESLVLICRRTSAGTATYNGNTYLDTMKRAATDAFLQKTHDAYKRAFGDAFSAEVDGMFVDEPHRGAFLADFSEGDSRSIPYTDGLFMRFIERFGYDVRPRLIDIFLRRQGEALSAPAHDYVQLTEELFLENFLSPLLAWCRRENVRLTGHLLHEDSLSAQTCMLGSMMPGYAYFDEPGIDVLGGENDCYWIGKLLTSAANQLGKKRLLTELYGGTGWQARFSDYKHVGDWQAMMGIDVFCPHLCWYSMQGENKRDYPASIFYQSAWYREYRYIEDYYARIHFAMKGEPADCRLLVLTPVESVWARAYSGSFTWLNAADPAIRQIENVQRMVFTALMEAGIDFDYGDEGLLSEHGCVRGRELAVGRMRYDKVLLAGMDTMRAETLRLLKRFTAHGGTLLIAGEPPYAVNAAPDARLNDLLRCAVQAPLQKKPLAKACAPAAPLCTLQNTRGQVYMQARKCENRVTVMLWNRDAARETPKIRLHLRHSGYVYRLYPRSGQIRRAVARAQGDGCLLTLQLAPGEEALFLLTDGCMPAAAEPKPLDPGRFMPLSQDTFSYQLLEDNIAVLDRVDVTVDGAPVAQNEEVLRADRAVRDRLGLAYRGGEMMQPWHVRKFAPETLGPLAACRATYRFIVETAPDALDVAVEDMAAIERILVNEATVAIETNGTWIDAAFTRIRLDPAKLRKGRNELTIEYAYHRDRGLEAAYLLGQFAVRLVPGDDGTETPVLYALPARIRVGDVVSQGFPFYSGKLTYRLDAPTPGRTRIAFPACSGGAALWLAHGKTTETAAFHPLTADVQDLESFTAVLTRRNTFGPLHRAAPYSDICNPSSYMTGGDDWQARYSLIPQGLLASPRIAPLP